MSTFFVFAFLLLVVSLAVLLRGLTKPANPGSNPVDVNVEIAKENKRSLEHALAAGELSQENFEQELQQLESALASNISSAPAKIANSRGQWVAAGLMIIGVPLAAGLLYLKLGNPTAINAATQPQTTAASTEGLPPLAELLPSLESRLQENPDDAQGWKLLGRSSLMVGDFNRAAEASRRALELDDQDVNVMAQLSEAVAMQQNGDMRGEPIELAMAVLTINPEHQHATWLAAIADQQQGEHTAAIEKFEKLLVAAKDDPSALQSINDMLAVSKAAIGMVTSTTETAEVAPSVDTGSSIEVIAELSASIAPDLPGTTSVFIYARASTGPPMPLAVARLQLKDLPATVTLDDSMAMVPSMTLSTFNDVVIGARISPTGNAIRQPGDWMGETTSIQVDTQDQAVKVTIDTMVE